MQIIALGSVILLRAIEGKPFNWKGPMGIILFVVQLFGIGFREELLFRGIVGNAIGRKYGRDNKGVWFSTIMVALMFGLMHMTNVFAGVKLSSVVIQSIVAVGAGMMLNAVYYRGGSIWALIFIHSLVDFVGLFSTLFEDSVSEIEVINSIELQNLAPFFLCTIVTIILLRKSKIGEAVSFLCEAEPIYKLPIKNVSCAVIQDNGKVFITQRAYGEYKDKWEFPGGKLEVNESFEDAIKREIKEELNTEISINKFLCNVEYDYNDFHLNMNCYLCDIISGNLELIEHEDAKWVKVSELDSIDFLAADTEIIKMLKRVVKIS